MSVLKSVTALLVALLAAVPAPAEVDFLRDVRPILSDKCFACHGPDAEDRAADLRLDLEEPAKADLGGYRVIDTRAPEESELLLRIYSDDEYYQMPPPEAHKELTQREKDVLEEWVRAGAPWSDPWAYEKPKWTEPPGVARTNWPSNWVDNFVLARIEAASLTPAPQADAVTLIRRLAFDLTGLPPDPELVAAYQDAPTSEAYERVVDTLLESQRFGERMAIYWLDLVRYADTVGYHGDQEQPVWPYRDYVIHSFNSNKPFDEFTEQQLAGDLLPGSGEDDKIASAYNRLLQTSHEGGVQLKEYRAIYLADRVRNVSQVWMAATMGCCQCHDHKFDPLPMDEFYTLGAFFADIDDEDHLRNQYDGRNNRNPTRRAPQLAVQSVYQRLELQTLDGEIAALEAIDQEDGKKRLALLRKQRDRLASPTSLPISKSTAPREVRVLPRGDWQDETGEVVTPQAPAALGWASQEGRATRLDLAHWLTDHHQGAGLLTARVMVNRYWYLMFGEGLSRSLGDFGGQGEAPTHPQLLDNLAVEFAESGWDVKQLIKRIVMSRAYQQSSIATAERLERDPENRLIARQGRHRLPAEMVRDNALAASGLLVEKLGGPSVRPYQPKDYYKHLNFPERTYRADSDASQYRRGVYVHWQRQYLHPTFKALDAPTREECTAQRPRSNTPLASLALLNDPTFVEAARVFAGDVLTQAGPDPNERIEQIFLRTLSRPPDELERRTLATLVQTQRDFYQAHQGEAKKLVGVGLYPVATNVPLPELAAWTFACRTVLNLSEAVSRN